MQLLVQALLTVTTNYEYIQFVAFTCMQESREVVPVELPVYISDRVRDHFIQSQSENPGVLVTLHQDESVHMNNSDIFQGCDDIIYS